MEVRRWRTVARDFHYMLEGTGGRRQLRRVSARLGKAPDLGDVIEGTGGIRKVRVASRVHGKRGRSQVIYYHLTSASQIALLLICPKNEKDELSADERRALKQIIERWS